MKIELMGPVAPGYLASPADVRAIKRVLSGCGVYLPDPRQGLDGTADAAFFDSLRTFQRMHMIPFTDEAAPGSVTERILNEDYESLAQNGEAYVWRTVGDDKVRGEHAARKGHTYIWSDPPDGENPGEDYNCRCWAEPVNPSRHVLAEEVRLRQEEMNLLNALQSMAPPSGVNTEMMTEVPLDAINPVYPIEAVLAGRALYKGAKYGVTKLEKSLRDTTWTLGKHKSDTKWSNQMRDRNWTTEKITETLRNGRKHSAPNKVNEGNKATRYEYQGNFVVRDEATKEIIQLGAENFVRLK